MGWSRWLLIVLAGCRLNFDDVAANADGAIASDDGVVDGSVTTACVRAIPTTPTYYCDTTNGDDTNPGTQSLPTKTITQAIARAASTGGTVIVAPGIYAESVDISTTQPLLLVSEQRYGARVTRLNCGGCTDLTVDGFEITGASLPLFSITGGTRVTVRNNVLHNGPTAGIRVTSGSSMIEIANNVVYDTFATQIHVNVATNVNIRDNVVFHDQGTSTGISKIWLEAAADARVVGNVVFRGIGDDPAYGMISLRDTTGSTIVENNVVGGSPNATSVHASIGFDLATGSATIRHNTFVGAMPGPAFGLGASAVMTGSSFLLVNNLWASAGTTQPFTDGTATGLVTLRRNLYWNAPSGPFVAGGAPTSANDNQALVTDPGISFALPAAPAFVTATRTFVGGATTTCELHAQLVDAMATIGPGSPAVGAADPTESPGFDIRGRTRPGVATIGAYEP